MAKIDRRELRMLRKTLAEIVPDSAEARIVAQDADLDLTRIDLSGSPEVMWHRILAEAVKQGPKVLQALVAESVDMYPGNPDLQKWRILLDDTTRAPDAGPVNFPASSGQIKPRISGEFDLFCSYRSTEMRRVQPVIEALRRRGVRIFVDMEQIAVGDSIVHALEGALSQALGILLFVSADALESRWVELEYDAAIVRKARAPGFRILPVLLEDCELPLFLQTYYALDLRNVPPGSHLPDPVERQLDKVAESLARLRDPPEDDSDLEEERGEGWMKMLEFARAATR